MFITGPSILVIDGLLGSEIHSGHLDVVLFAFGDFIIVIELPYHIGYVFFMLSIHPCHDISTAGIACAHEGA